jgi:hypothetical protein
MNEVGGVSPYKVKDTIFERERKRERERER